MFQRAIALSLCLLLSACANHHMPWVLTPLAETAADAKPVDILVATSRGYDVASGQFDDKRARNLSYQAIRISIPPAHVTGEVEWPSEFPGDPKRHFVALKNEMLTDEGMTRNISRMIPPSGDVVVFVHGYNTTHEEGVFRFSQIVADSDIKALPILFSWPSRGEVKDYVTDRESIMSSRNRLDQFLRQLSLNPRVKRIDLLAHSMGTMLTMETLVQAKLRGDANYTGKLDSIVLAAPDIDVDVFQSQFEIIGKRDRPTTILTSRDDRALAISSKIAGNVVRVGAASPRARATIETVKRLGLTVVDMTEVKATDGANHGKFANSPVFIRQLGTHLGGGSPQSTSVGTVGSFIVDTAGTILETPSTILREIARR